MKRSISKRTFERRVKARLTEIVKLENEAVYESEAMVASAAPVVQNNMKNSFFPYSFFYS